MLDLTFLAEEQIFGKNKLDILKKYGTKCVITDFSILLGGDARDNIYTRDGFLLNERTGWWWTKSSNKKYKAIIVSRNGSSYDYSTDSFNGGARPALSYSSISSLSSKGVRGQNGILEVEYGEYPQTVVSEDLAGILEIVYSCGTINETGKRYTTTSLVSLPSRFQKKSHIEYEYKGRKYIRFVADSNCSENVLSDGRIIQDGCVYWVEVEPIRWMIDERTNIALSKKLLFSGVKFNKCNYKGLFNETDIKKFMDMYFSKDIIPSKNNFVENENKFNNLNNLDSWLAWSNENNIHPVIHMFMIYSEGKYLNNEIDWEVVSNELYKTDDICLLYNLLDWDIYISLINLYSVEVSKEDILNNDYDINIIKNMSNFEKYLLVIKLTLVNQDNYDNILNFLKKLGNKYSSLYEILYKQCIMEKNKCSIKKLK